MYKILLFLPFLITSNLWLNAQNILRVSPVVNEGDYTNLQTAIDAAAPNDIVMVYPGTYGNIQLDKPLKVYGPGYLITQNPTLGIQTIKQDAKIGTLTCTAACSGAEVKGFYMNRFVVDGVAGLVLKGNYIEHLGANNESVISNSSAIIVQGNYFYIGLVGLYNKALALGNSCTDILVQNNIFEGCCNAWHTHYGLFMSQSGGGSSIIFRHNISMLKNRFYYSEVYNNIFSNPNGGTAWNDGATNTATNNMVGIAGNTFVQGTYSFDAKFQLAPGSPAIGAGVNGADLGAFGGPTPYKLSGVSDIPLIYELNVPAEAPPGSIQVNIKVRAEN